jgi:BASS family bile acid:Na+ symporter
VLAGAWVEVSFLAMVLSVVKVVLIPVLIGLLLNVILSRQVEAVKPVLPLISVVAIVMIIAGIVAVNKEKLLDCALLTLVVVVLHNVFGMALGFLVAKAFKFNYEQTTAISIEVGIQNSGLAVSLATANFAANPMATLPGAIFSVWHNIAGSVFASARRRGAGVRETSAINPAET